MFSSFQGGSLVEAQRQAQQKARMLFVFLYCEDNLLCERVQQMIDQNTQVQHLLEGQFIPWACSVSTPEGYEYETDFGVRRLPFIALGVGKRFVAAMDGKFTVADLIGAMEKSLEIAGPDLAKEIAFQAERQERELLRLQQETALAEAMKHDKARAAARAAEKSAREAAAKAAAEAAARDEAERLAVEQAAREEERRREEEARAVETARAVALSALSDEPAADDHSDVAHIKLMTADGTPVMRRFRGAEPIALLFALAESTPQFNGKPYELIAGFPPKAIDRNSKETFKEVKALYPRSQVIVRPS